MIYSCNTLGKMYIICKDFPKVIYLANKINYSKA